MIAQPFTAIGRAVLIAREGRVLKAYRDSVGVWTCGVGHTSAAGPPLVTPGLTITSAECDAIFARDVEKYARTVRESVTVPLEDHQFDALTSLCYNIGQGGFAKSTIVKRLNAGDPGGAADAFLMWRKPPEIVSRRQAEAAQFRTPYTIALPKARINDARPVAVSPVVVPREVVVLGAPVTVAPKAPVIEPVILPRKVSALSRFGAWFDRIWQGPPDVAARG